MTTFNNIVSLYWPSTAHNRSLRAVLFVVAGVGLLTLSAKIKVPYYPVPMTLQTLVVLLLGGSYGPRLALATVVAYLALGIGLPVFSGGGGLIYFTGKTGGFLLGFIPAVVVAGYAVKRYAAHNFWKLLFCLAIADLLIFVCGVLQLGLIINNFETALQFGFYPFIIGDVSKVVLAAALVMLAVKMRTQQKP